MRHIQTFILKLYIHYHSKIFFVALTSEQTTYQLLGYEYASKMRADLKTQFVDWLLEYMAQCPQVSRLVGITVNRTLFKLI